MTVLKYSVYLCQASAYLDIKLILCAIPKIHPHSEHENLCNTSHNYSSMTNTSHEATFLISSSKMFQSFRYKPPPTPNIETYAVSNKST